MRLTSEVKDSIAIGSMICATACKEKIFLVISKLTKFVHKITLA